MNRKRTSPPQDKGTRNRAPTIRPATAAAAPSKRRVREKREGLLRRIRQWFGRPLRIVRRGLNFHIVFASPGGAQGKLPPAAAHSARSVGVTGDASLDPVAQEVRQISKQLRARLDRHAMSRTVFTQLAIVEREFRSRGYPGLHSLPIELLQTALEQLALVTGRLPGELGTLRTKMLESILARQPKAGDFGAHLGLSTFDTPHKLHVADASESAFFHAAREWQERGAAPQARATAVPL